MDKMYEMQKQGKKPKDVSYYAKRVKELKSRLSELKGIQEPSRIHPDQYRHTFPGEIKQLAGAVKLCQSKLRRLRQEKKAEKKAAKESPTPAAAEV